MGLPRPQDDLGPSRQSFLYILTILEIVADLEKILPVIRDVDLLWFAREVQGHQGHLPCMILAENECLLVLGVQKLKLAVYQQISMGLAEFDHSPPK